MADTLTWKYATMAASNSGTTPAAFLTDLKARIDANSADPAYLWEVCGSELVTTPLYLVLRRKDLSAGRVLVVSWTSGPAGNNAAILDQAPTANAIYCAFFPGGTANTPSNLTAASGTIMGNDAGAIKCVAAGPASTIHAASFRVAYVETAESFGFFTFANTGSSTIYGALVGNILVDGTDTAYPAAYAGGSSGFNFAVASSNPLVWQTSAILAGNGSSAQLRTNAGETNRTMYLAYTPSGPWNAQTFAASTDPTVDSASGRLFLMAVPVVGRSGTKDGTALKFRQIALGPSASAAWPSINISGPTKVATGLWGFAPSSSAATLWLTDVKI
jgi:hypothetical protein